jgi:hypothetical protein
MRQLTLMRRVAKVARRDTAPMTAMQWALRRLPFVPVRFGILCFLQLDGVPDVRASWLRGPGVVRAATPDDLEALVACQDKRQTFIERFAIGDHCVVALIDNRIVGYEWFSDRPTHREGNHGYLIQIPRGFVYNYDAYIDPRYRNSGFWVRFKAYQAGLMNTIGRARVLTFVEYGNSSSLKAHLRFGFKPIRQVTALSVLGITLFKEQDAQLVRDRSGIWQ